MNASRIRNGLRGTSLTMAKAKRYRPDMDGGFQTQYEKNRKTILASQEICAICGQPVNKKLKFPNPLSPSIDHIIPIAKGGHPADIENLQLTHLKCNQAKATKVVFENNKNLSKQSETISNRVLPQSMNWATYTV